MLIPGKTPEEFWEISNGTRLPRNWQFVKKNPPRVHVKPLFDTFIHPLLSRINKRRYGWSIRGETRAFGVRSIHDPGKLYWWFGCLRVLHGQHSRGLPGCFQGTRDHKQQLAASTAREGA